LRRGEGTLLTRSRHDDCPIAVIRLDAEQSMLTQIKWLSAENYLTPSVPVRRHLLFITGSVRKAGQSSLWKSLGMEHR